MLFFLLLFDKNLKKKKFQQSTLLLANEDFNNFLFVKLFIPPIQKLFFERFFEQYFWIFWGQNKMGFSLI